MPSAPTRSVCPVACTLDLVGDRWTLLVIRDLFAGRSRFGEFLRSPEGIATNILTARLEHLISSGLVRATPCRARTGASVYTLTARGRSLRPVLECIAAWGLEHIPGTEARMELPNRGTE
ncbi:MAG: winged helix-turn-helix transcriptional regulator [Phycisphaerales bacterium]